MKVESYNDVKEMLETLPITWYASLLNHMIKIVHKEKIFNGNGLLRFLERCERDKEN
jgi:hypothetical protein